MSSTSPSIAGSGRVLSIDALRGFDMFWIIGGGEVVKAVLGLFFADLPHSVQAHMEHVPWEGFVAWDLIMPLFLFIVGAAIPFSMGKRVELGQSVPSLYFRVIRRVIVLWILGTIAQGNLLTYDLSKLQLFSNTLQAIAVGYLVASIAVLHLRVIGQLVLTTMLLIGFYVLMLWVPWPGHDAGALEGKANLAWYVDEFVLRGFRDQGESYTYTWVLSSLGFAATTLLGVMAGHLLRTRWSPWIKVFWLMVSGGLCLALGSLWGGYLVDLGPVDPWRFPVIKHLWTSSMVLWAAGWSYLLLALFYLVIDVLGLRRWAFFFMVIGANAITAYMAVRIVNFYEIADRLIGGLASQLTSQPSPWPAVAHAMPPVVAFSLLWLMLLYMYQKGSFLRV